MRWRRGLAFIGCVEVIYQEVKVGIRRPVQSYVESALSILSRQAFRSELECVAKGIL
jgi:hypothetical protein